MGRWYAMLAGTVCDLKAATACFDLPEATVVPHAEAHTCLASWDFDGLGTPCDVEERGVEILRLVHGALRVAADNYRPVHLWSIHRKDSVGYHVCAASRDRWHRQASWDDRESSDLWLADTERAATARRLFRIARSEPSVARAFDLWGADRHGVVVYKIFELIRDDLGDGLDAFASRASVGRFTASVNHPDVLGDYARHEVQPGDAPRRRMTRHEVERFIQELLSPWALAKAKDPIIPGEQ